MKTKRPLAEAEAAAKTIAAIISPVCERVEIAGSIRRRRPEVGDIELIAIPKIDYETVPSPTLDIFTPDLQATTQRRRHRLWEFLDLQRTPFTKKGDVYRQFYWESWQVDLFTAGADNWGLILLIRTGSADFSHWIMGQLNAAGYTSSGGRLYKRDMLVCDKNLPKGDPIETRDEMEVFRRAGHIFLDPTKREIGPGVYRR